MIQLQNKIDIENVPVNIVILLFIINMAQNILTKKSKKT